MPLLTLNPAQQAAIETLLTGGSHAEAAAISGVTRETVSRWVGHHPEFRAALDIHRSNLAVEQADAIHAIRGRALAIVAAHLEEATMQEALAVLRFVGAPVAVSDRVPLCSSELLDAERVRTKTIMPERQPSGDLRVDVIDELTGVAAVRERDRVEHLTLKRIANAVGYDATAIGG